MFAHISSWLSKHPLDSQGAPKSAMGYGQTWSRRMLLQWFPPHMSAVQTCAETMSVTPAREPGHRKRAQNFDLTAGHRSPGLAWQLRGRCLQCKHARGEPEQTDSPRARWTVKGKGSSRSGHVQENFGLVSQSQAKSGDLALPRWLGPRVLACPVWPDTATKQIDFGVGTGYIFVWKL